MTVAFVNFPPSQSYDEALNDVNCGGVSKLSAQLKWYKPFFLLDLKGRREGKKVMGEEGGALIGGQYYV